MFLQIDLASEEDIETLARRIQVLIIEMLLDFIFISFSCSYAKVVALCCV